MSPNCLKCGVFVSEPTRFKHFPEGFLCSTFCFVSYLLDSDAKFRVSITSFLLKRGLRVGDFLLWNDGTIDKNGYGFVPSRRFRTTMGVHRLSYLVFKGSFEKDWFVCHSCDNRACFEPNHLWLGTPMQNHNDMIDKGRGNKKSFLPVSI